MKIMASFSQSENLHSRSGEVNERRAATLGLLMVWEYFMIQDKGD
jgi:hypothetical protein